MATDAEKLASAIGGRVRQERQSRGWTLDQLAGAAQVSRRLLVTIEQGSANPSIATLLRIGDALGVGLPALVEPPQRVGMRVTRRGEGATLWTSEAGGRALLVAGTRPPDVAELWDWTLAPDDRHSSSAHSSGTTELLQVLDGTVTLTVDDEVVVLAVGDAVSFAGDLPHAYANAGSSSARFSLAVFEPGVTPATPMEPSHD